MSITYNLCFSFARHKLNIMSSGSLNGIFQQASNELNKLSGKKLSQTGSQMMSRPNGLTSITQTQVRIFEPRSEKTGLRGFRPG